MPLKKGTVCSGHHQIAAVLDRLEGIPNIHFAANVADTFGNGSPRNSMPAMLRASCPSPPSPHLKSRQVIGQGFWLRADRPDPSFLPIRLAPFAPHRRTAF